jgi:ribosomal protein L21E
VTRRGIRKARQKGQSKESPQSEETNKTGDNVPTIEIIVMPVPVSLEQHTASEGSTGGIGNERGSVYRVVFPAESKMQTVFHAQDEAALSQCNQQQDQEVPVASTTL